MTTDGETDALGYLSRAAQYLKTQGPRLLEQGLVPQLLVTVEGVMILIESASLRRIEHLITFQEIRNARVDVLKQGIDDCIKQITA